MNQFKVGDTVWTVKRGELIIIQNRHTGTRYRPFWVQSASNSTRVYSPKLSNLYRTEAEMIKAKKCDIGHVWFSAVGFWQNLLDPPQPKFKRGDKVYYEGKKWEVFCERQEKPNRYQLRRGDTKRYLLAYAGESSLRLWEEHEFTHMAAGNEPKGMGISKITDWDKRDINPSAYKSVTYLGVSASKMDTFHCVTNEGTSVIIYGKKGDIEI